MTVEFKKLQTPTYKELFITQIEQMIISGEFEIGQKLPSERELSQKMGVSRAIVNSGIAEMARKGFIEIRPRVGNFVADYRRNGTVETLVSIMKYNGGTLRPAEIKSLIEFRCVVDNMVIQLIDGKLTDEQKKTLKEIVNKIGISATPAEAAENTQLFHHELALISGNTIVPLIYASFSPTSTHLWERYARKNGIDRLYANCSILLDYICSGHTEEAVAWKLKYTEDVLYGDTQIFDEI